jgi:hypothetical protein
VIDVSIKLDFTEAERDYIEKFLTESESERPSIESYLETWEGVVHRIQAEGYHMPIESFINDLDIRHTIYRLLLGAPVSIQGKISPVLNELDQKYLSSTQVPKKEVFWKDYYPDEPWVARVPIKYAADDLLKRDLLRYGYI